MYPGQEYFFNDQRSCKEQFDRHNRIWNRTMNNDDNTKISYTDDPFNFTRNEGF